MSVHTLFKSRKGPMNIPAPDGQLLKFANGRFFTANKEYEEFLQGLADRRECYIYVDPEEPEVDTEAMSPYEAMKKKIIEDHEREKARLNPNSVSQTAPGNTSQPAPLAQSATSTQGTATPALNQAAAKVKGDTGEAEQKAPEAPSKLEELKKGTATSTNTTKK